METKTADLIVRATSPDGNEIDDLCYTLKNVSSLLINVVIDEQKAWFNQMNSLNRLDPDTHVTFDWTVDSNNFILDCWNSDWE